MISTVADLLEALRHKEVQLLDKQDITHAPTIGRMYEGLTRKILEKTFPEGLDLRVVSGFITNSRGDLSKQIDCMLVSGEGERIPYTHDYKYHIQNVIAVVEVKKNLYSSDLDSAYKNLITVLNLQLQEEGLPLNRLFNDAHRAILRSDPDIYDDVSKLPTWKFQIGLALYIESTAPIRIVLGYHGFTSESSFRRSFIQYLDKNVFAKDYGAVHFPNLIICGGYSLIKLNGMPYSIPVVSNQAELYAAYGMPNLAEAAPIQSDLWPLYASYASNPMVLLLELILTRITYDKKIFSFALGSDLNLEILKPLLLAKAIEWEEEVAWYCEPFFLPPNILNRIPSTANWQPIELNEGQFFVLARLLWRENAGITEGLDVDSPELLAEFQNSDYSLSNSIAFLQRVGLVSFEGGKLQLLTRGLKVAFLPDDRVVAGEDVSGRFSNWLTKYMQDLNAE